MSQSRKSTLNKKFFISRLSVLQTESWNFLSDPVVPNGMKGLWKRQPRLFSQFNRTSINVELLWKTKAFHLRRVNILGGGAMGANAPSIVFCT